MNRFEMVARVGDSMLSVGKCTSAQARILVKAEHAAWLDGKLLLPLSPELLQMAVNHLDGPLDDANVSKKERERRMAWLANLLNVQATSRAQRGTSRIDQIVGHALVLEAGVFLVHSEDQDPWSSDPTDLAEWYDKSAPAPAPESEPPFEPDNHPKASCGWCASWDSTKSPVLLERPKPDRGWREVLEEKGKSEWVAELEDVQVAFSPRFNPARWPKTTLLGEPPRR